MEKRTPERVIELDLLRFLAAMIVVFYHRVDPELGLGLYHVTQLGWVGVELFFMISGFVILWTASNKTGWGFISSRIARLYPSFWLCLTFTLLALAAAGQTVTGPLILTNYTMVPSIVGQPNADPVYWSLLVEIKFYAIMFVLLITGQIKRIERWMWGWLALSVAFVAKPNGVLYQLTFAGVAPFFIAGCFYYCVRSHGMNASRAAALVVSMILGVYYVATGTEGTVRQPMAHVEIVVSVIIVAGFAVFALIALRRFHLPNWKIWSTLGAMSYPIYLLHNTAVRYAVVEPMNAAGVHSWVALAASIGVTLILSLFLAMTVERYTCQAFNRWLLSIPARYRPVEGRVSA